MTKLGRKEKYGPEYDQNIPYLEYLLNTFSGRNNKRNARNQLIHFYSWIKKKSKLTDLLQVSYEQIKTFFETDIDKRDIDYPAKRSWYSLLNKYYEIIQELSRSKNIEFTNPVPSLRVLNLQKRDLNLHDLRIRGKMKRLEYSQVEKLLNYFFYNKFQYFIIVGLLVYSGARITEVISIKKENIELGKTNIKVIHPKSDPKTPTHVIVNLRLFLNKIKGNKFGVYYYPEFFLQYLNLYIEHLNLIFPRSAFVFPSTRVKNSHLNTETVRYHLKKTCKLLQIDIRITPHSFRSLLNKNRTRMGIDPDDRSILLNHVVQRTESRFYNKDLGEFAKVQVIYDNSFPYSKFTPDPNYLK